MKNESFWWLLEFKPEFAKLKLFCWVWHPKKNPTRARFYCSKEGKKIGFAAVEFCRPSVLDLSALESLSTGQEQFLKLAWARHTKDFRPTDVYADKAVFAKVG